MPDTPPLSAPVRGFFPSSSDTKAKQPNGSKSKLTKATSLPGKNGNPTFAAVAAGYDKSPGEWPAPTAFHFRTVDVPCRLCPAGPHTDSQFLLQVGMDLLKFLQTNQIFPAALAFHTFLLTVMALTGMWLTLGQQRGWDSPGRVVSFLRQPP